MCYGDRQGVSDRTEHVGRVWAWGGKGPYMIRVIYVISIYNAAVGLGKGKYVRVICGC